jgi:diguanylate cyclase (GGDEF)-like protein
MDPITAFLIGVLMMLMNGAILGIMHRSLSPDVQPAARDWRIGTLVAAGGTLLIVAQAWTQVLWVILIANVCLYLGVCLFWRAVRRFAGQADHWWIFLPLIIGSIGTAIFIWIEPSFRARVIVSAATWIVPLYASAYSLWMMRKSDIEFLPNRGSRVLAVLFLIVGFFTTVRCIVFLFSEMPVNNVLDPKFWMNSLTPVLLATLPVLGTTAFLVMCSERIRQQWERAAATDYLTDLPNRRTITVNAESRFAAARRAGQPLSIAVIDLDYFKSVNDAFGHAVGDIALKHVANVLETTCRGSFMVGRYGGEEFVAIFEQADEHGARAAAERVRHAVERAPLALYGNSHAFTVSIGVTSMRAGDTRVEDMLRRADLALYVAKDEGRNRVKFA